MERPRLVPRFVRSRNPGPNDPPRELPMRRGRLSKDLSAVVQELGRGFKVEAVTLEDGTTIAPELWAIRSVQYPAIYEALMQLLEEVKELESEKVQ